MISPFKTPKIAIFYDWLNHPHGGAEKVLLCLLRLYPQADLYTLVYDPLKTSWIPQKTKITTSIINQLPLAKHNLPLYTPFYDLALEQFDFRQYDIVISTTSTIGHCLLTGPQTLYICYFHNINRHLYSRHSFLFRLYQQFDRIYSRRPDHILCNSKTVQTRLDATYQLPATIVYPGINTHFYRPSKVVGPPRHFLIVGRLVSHKNIALCIKTFASLPYRLLVVGSGRDYYRLKLLALGHHNIRFVTKASDRQLRTYYRQSFAVICPQIEDFGLIALEAQACGKPVIAYRRGGHTETLVDSKTAIFFKQLTINSLQTALTKFFRNQFDPLTCRRNALNYSQDRFMLNFKQQITRLWQQHQTTTS